MERKTNYHREAVECIYCTFVLSQSSEELQTRWWWSAWLLCTCFSKITPTDWCWWQIDLTDSLLLSHPYNIMSAWPKIRISRLKQIMKKRGGGVTLGWLIFNYHTLESTVKPDLPSRAIDCFLCLLETMVKHIWKHQGQEKICINHAIQSSFHSIVPFNRAIIQSAIQSLFILVWWLDQQIT